MHAYEEIVLFNYKKYKMLIEFNLIIRSPNCFTNMKITSSKIKL